MICMGAGNAPDTEPVRPDPFPTFATTVPAPGAQVDAATLSEIRVTMDPPGTPVGTLCIHDALGVGGQCQAFGSDVTEATLTLPAGWVKPDRTYRISATAGVPGSQTFTYSALLGLPARVIAGADMAGELGDVGVWTEVAVVNPVHQGQSYTNVDSLYMQADLGANYTFDNGLFIMGEYYYNGLGAWEPDDYTGTDLIRLFTLSR